MGPREEFVKFVRDQLVGPAQDEHETVTSPPDRQYVMGTLYPQDADLHRQLTLSAEVLDAPGAEEQREDNAHRDDPVPEANSWLPSSLGLSLFTTAAELRVTVEGARYLTERGERGRCWRRVPLPAEAHSLKPGEPKALVFDGRGEIRVTWRTFGHGRLVTVALVNTARASRQLLGAAERERQWDNMLFQVGLDVDVIDGEVLPYPGVRLASRDEEEQELRLQYRHVKTYAVGHGCAAREERAGHGPVTRVRAEVMPQTEVPVVRAAGPRSPALLLERLADESLPVARLRAELSEFAGGYRDWFEKQRAMDVPPWARPAARRVLERIETAVQRMESGVKTLCAEENEDLRRAFRTANAAMALQMRHSEPDQAGQRHARSAAVQLDPAPDPTAAWRPFQLAFFLMALEGAADATHPDRETVDLIWFPTGGGKTEAYLLLAAFVMVLRRLRPRGTLGGGTAVLSRYTLSLLTTQQFQRAATTVCALERLRRADPAALGREPFSIGLWVGEATTPNSYQAAVEAFDEVRAAATPDDRFILDRCPWCGTRIVPEHKSPDRSDYGIDAGASSFRFFCPRDDCAFHDRLPVAVVDDHLYDKPPTFVLGTVDKFARLAWERNAGRLFGSGGDLPPDLVIQDELHLLTGPLGTTVGLYEAAILQLCSPAEQGPKIVASTATIRRSGEQVRKLYGRPVQLFPPAGLDARSSYFAEPDMGRPGRLYLGVMAQGHTAGRATVATAATLLQAPLQLPEEHRDDYWTLVAYHHSLRELGRTVTAAADDIPAQLAGIGPVDERRVLTEGQVQELTSSLDRSEQPLVLDRLEKPWDHPAAISLLPCTNMLSVGVDVKRLALMLLLGQPKATAEYIQATSRVGRHNVPGLVVTFLNATKPRDRSHYETFGTYHSALYRHVEPTTVTPWSVPSRRRALHAALVVLVRHGLGLSAEDAAGEVLDRVADISTQAERLVEWVTRSDPEAAPGVRDDLFRLFHEWQEAAREARADGKCLHYRTQGKGQHNLLRDFDRGGGLWETPHSMRNVDRECQVVVKGADA
ncbi:helicase-related protein [Streptomyces sp. NPDC006971]|uniref:helicase-related protein n=1 Tax=Streptomyces sp. NPDC006971 TaxID=3154784 RepID=UPI0033FDDC93